MLTDTGFRYEIKSLINLLDQVSWDSKNRCYLNEPTGHWLYDHYKIKDCWKNTEFEKILSEFPFPVGEARLMKLLPGGSYCAHSDIDDRYHLNLTSNDQSYLIDLEEKEFHQLIPDGVLYKMNAGKIHTACNFGSTDRIQLVIRVPMVRHTGEDYVTKIIIFRNPEFNFRYIFDNEISKYLNRLSKESCLGFFNPRSDTELEIHIKKEKFQELIKKITIIHKEIEIHD